MTEQFPSATPEQKFDHRTKGESMRAIIGMLSGSIIACGTAIAAETADLGVMGADGILRSADEQRPPAAPEQVDAATLPVIIGATQARVAAVLGAPDDSCQTTEMGPKCSYRSGAIEIVYIDGIADWITYHRPAAVGYFPAAALMLGIECPVSEDAMIWTAVQIAWRRSCGDLVEVQLFPGPVDAAGDRGIDYLYLKARTP